MTLFTPAFPTASAPNEVTQTVARLGQESTLFTQLRQQPPYNPIAMGVVQPTTTPQFNNNMVGSFAPPLRDKPNYMFVAQASGQQSMSGGNQQPRG